MSDLESGTYAMMPTGAQAEKIETDWDEGRICQNARVEDHSIVTILSFRFLSFTSDIDAFGAHLLKYRYSNVLQYRQMRGGVVCL